VWYFALLHELIFWLKVRQKAEINIKNFKKFPGVTPLNGYPLQEVATPSRTYPQHGCFGCAWKQAPPVLRHKL